VVVVAGPIVVDPPVVAHTVAEAALVAIVDCP
jgi:hypothetical protein